VAGLVRWGWATSIAFQRYRLEPTEEVEIRSHDDVGPGSDVLLFAQGSLTLVDERGATRPYQEGATFAVYRRLDRNPGYRFTVRNDGNRCAVLLRLSTNSCRQCGGGAILNAVPPLGPSRSFRCDEPVKAPIVFGRGIGQTVSFAMRVVVDPGAEWDFGNRLGYVVLAVERGRLVLGDTAGDALRLDPGDIAEIAEPDPHRVANLGDEPASFLLVGSVDAHGGHGVLEVRRAECPPGAQRPYLLNCRRGPDRLTPIGVTGPSGFSAFQASEPAGADSGAPSVVIFRGLEGGRYHLTDHAAVEGDRAAISCVEQDAEGFGDGPLVAEFTGDATRGIDVDLVSGASVVCYWYSGFS
jgi:quercetin dioxygenase-like cupin family protein